MSPPPADAVGSYGPEAIEWIEKVERKTLRWWQALAITRQLEHRQDGSLCHRVVLESAPRRAGKSVRVRGVALWRMAHPEVFGEVQNVLHTGSDVAICREIQRGAWRWAEEDAGWTVSRSNGKEAMETPTGDRWLVRAQTAVYGYDVGFGVVDEAWDVKPDTVSEGLEPATLERLSPQIHLTSTAHRRATSLMRSRIQSALTAADPSTLFLLWAAPADADPGDPEVWRAASPYWSEDRRQMIAGKYATAQAGEVDPQADDPDPMAGFTAQYLNVWTLKATTIERGQGVVDGDEWEALSDTRPTRAPDAAAVESWFGEGVSLALAWKVGDRAVVSISDHPDLPQAAEALKAAGFAGTATIGASLLEDPAFSGMKAQKGQGRTGAAVHDLDRLLSEDAFRHDGGEHLTRQALAVRTLPGADGPRMVSSVRADAVKAAVWAAHSARTLAPPRSPVVVL
ncbi:HNH endonuclease [Kribbella deserti]|uniref:HNH endonuclease n=1 Tax=Kribbella deserti TaxID=1926257 RepID=A0ABV6QV90_9ACTN